jgi:hypothetical protein
VLVELSFLNYFRISAALLVAAVLTACLLFLVSIGGLTETTYPNARGNTVSTVLEDTTHSTDVSIDPLRS